MRATFGSFAPNPVILGLWLQKDVIPGLVPGTKLAASSAIGPRDKPGDDGFLPPGLSSQTQCGVSGSAFCQRGAAADYGVSWLSGWEGVSQSISCRPARSRARSSEGGASGSTNPPASAAMAATDAQPGASGQSTRCRTPIRKAARAWPDAPAQSRMPKTGPLSRTLSMIARHQRHPANTPAPGADNNVTGRPGATAILASAKPWIVTAGWRIMLDVQALDRIQCKRHHVTDAH